LFGARAIAARGSSGPSKMRAVPSFPAKRNAVTDRDVSDYDMPSFGSRIGVSA
jgi:hypothetical protein